MRGDFIKINPWLKPLSWLYGIGVGFRNQLFELEILKSRSFKIPVISVGNITVGGSGKTPHVEYLIRLLQDKAKVAVLSRGYKRKSNGYVLAAADTTVEEIGDEPYQMKKKFPGIYVAVDKKRCHGIEQLTSDERTKDADVILLDDAFSTAMSNRASISCSSTTIASLPTTSCFPQADCANPFQPRTVQIWSSSPNVPKT